MKIAVVGTGQTRFGPSPKSLAELMTEASQQALAEAGLKIQSVDAVYLANFSSRFSQQCHLPAVFASCFEVGKEIVRVESACAAGGLALKEAVLALQTGRYQKVLVVGVEKMTAVSTSTATRILATAGSQEEQKHGATFPSLFALMAQRYLDHYSASEKHLALVAVKNHHHACLNPQAHFHRKITIKEVLASRVVASPLKLLDCSPLSDGAAAVLLAADKETARLSNKPIFLRGLGHEVGPIELTKRKSLTSMPTVIRAGKKAFEMSGFKPEDIDLAELHDCFTIAELIQMEDLAFCRPGEAKRWVETNRTQIGGDLPINPSGGLKAKGHPIGATGVAQVVEVVRQLQGGVGKRQVKKARVGLCCNIGGSGGTAVVTIFSQ